MDAREFEEILRQSYDSSGSHTSRVLTPMYSSSTLYGISEISRNSVRYIPLSPFQKVFISHRRIDSPPGYWKFSAIGKRMSSILSVFINAGYSLSGFRISGRGGSEAKVTGFPEFSRVALEEVKKSGNKNMDEVYLTREGSELRFDNSLSITLSGEFPDSGLIFQAMRMHESYASAISVMYSRTAVQKGPGNLSLSNETVKPGTLLDSVEWVPGRNISISVSEHSGTRIIHTEERENPSNWIRAAGDTSIRSIVRGPVCSFDFFASYIQMLGDAE